jgi:hypothetical protein
VYKQENEHAMKSPAIFVVYPTFSFAVCRAANVSLAGVQDACVAHIQNANA